MLAYHEGWIDSLVCPFFGRGCETVARSPHARHAGIPNAAAGLLGYAAMAALALGGRRPDHRRWTAVALGALAAGAGIASAFLTWEQHAKVRAWCFWCLTSAAINLAIVPAALVEAWRMSSWLDSDHPARHRRAVDGGARRP